MSTKSKSASATSTNPSKSTTSKKATKTLDNANAAKAALKVIPARESKYNYPASVKDAAGKKQFRRTARATAKRFEKEIAALAASNEKGAKKQLQSLEQEHTTWKASTYAVGA